MSDRQVSTRQVSVASIIRSRSFGIGVADARDGKPVREDWDLPQNKSTSGRNGGWAYARGRLFAVAAMAEGRHDLLMLKDGARVRRECMLYYARLMRQGVML